MIGVWYKKNKVITLILLLFYPVGLFLVWKFSDWTKKTKWIVTALFIVWTLILSIGIVSYYSPPSIVVSNAKNNQINTDDSEYTITGKLISSKTATLSINNNPVDVIDNEFSYQTSLAEGDNSFTLTSNNENGESETVITIHRTTQEEFEARNSETENNNAETTDNEQVDINQESSEGQNSSQNEDKQEDKSSNTESFYFNNAYFKGENNYDVVVYDSNKDTLRIYVNDENEVTAKVNNEGWATFEDVEIKGIAKLSFAKKTGWSDYQPINYVRYISVENEKVKILDETPKHTYNEFSKWLGSTIYYQPNKYVPGSSPQRFDVYRDKCGRLDGNFGSKWISCMQNSYREYIKPEAFVGTKNQSRILDLLGFVDGVNDFGLDNTFSKLTQDDVDRKMLVYYQFARTF